ncbi:acetyltransferase [Stieleria sp. ICT_E10.1]|uniref:acetyltransferase n=1 Tax=Stieleria sedimenti TaxID=2976331 RepID=UPI002180853C|nr:acetyltransferase [Stieleria sedimenti]MCS7469280.1 acetyltransferase [Stieleria sedimenti]
MFLKENQSEDLVRISHIDQLLSPLESEVLARRQAGEEEQDECQFAKSDLVFPSGEPLPRCWIDQKYQIR